MDNLGPIIVALLGGGLITGIVGIAGFFVNWRSKRQELESQREAEAYRAEQDALQKYLDEMGRLMDKLSSSGPEFEQARRVAQAWTMAILTGTGPSFKRELITLVYELGLITTPHPILELRNAPMERADLTELTLRDISLQDVDLRCAILHGADLEGSNLNLADLRGAVLRGADLSGTDLTDANLLPYDELNPTAWNKNNLEKRNTLQNGASLRKELKDRKELKGTNLSGATLRKAQFCGAWLHGVNLSGADLQGAKGISTEELDEQAFSLKGATMPDGQKYEDWLNDKESRGGD